MICSTGTTSLARSRSSDSRARCWRPPSDKARPSSCTSSGPSIRKSTELPSFFANLATLSAAGLTRGHNHSATVRRRIPADHQPPTRIVCGDETINQSKEQMGGLDWAVIALGAAGGVVALLGVAAAVTRRGQRRSELAKLTARGRTQLPERRMEVVAINDRRSDSKVSVHTQT